MKQILMTLLALGLSAQAFAYCIDGTRFTGAGILPPAPSYAIHYISATPGNPSTIHIQGRNLDGVTNQLFDRTIEAHEMSVTGTWGTLNGYGNLVIMQVNSNTWHLEGSTGSSMQTLIPVSADLTFNFTATPSNSFIPNSYTGNINRLTPLSVADGGQGVIFGERWNAGVRPYLAKISCLSEVLLKDSFEDLW